MAKENIILKLDSVNKEYLSPGKDSKISVLNNISISISEMDSIAITGPSGSGKSTLLNIMGGLDLPTSGKVFFNNLELTEISDDKLSYLRNQEIGFIFQMYHLLPQCTVLENVLIPTIPFQKMPSGEYHDRAIFLLKAVGLEDRINHKPYQLSGGEQLRTAVVRALINKPKILLADEPTGSLDNKTAKDLSKLIVELNKKENITLILVTHSNELAEMMNKIYTLKDGSLKL